MNELAQALVADSYAASPAHILEGLTEELAHRKFASAPHTIYEELWHLAFWQQITLEWVRGTETPFPERPEDAFPRWPGSGSEGLERESVDQLRSRFLSTAREAAEVAGDAAALERPIRCPSRPGVAVRIMSVRDQLISLAAHNAYHLGRIVVLRQIHGSWPPPSGGFTW